MKGGNNFMDLTVLFPVASGAIGGAISSGAINGPIQTLNDCWYNYIGHYFSESAKLRKIQEEHNVEKFKEELKSDLQQIKPENLQSPRRSIMNRTMEVSIHYLDEEEIRKIFSRLIAASMDSSKNKTAHNAFVEITKQMSPLDAQNLKLFSNNKCLPIVRIVSHPSHTELEYSILEDNVFLENHQYSDFRHIASSLTNLERMGLIKITYNSWEDYSSRFAGTATYEKFGYSEPFISIRNAKASKNTEVSIDRGIIEITPFGEDFINVCLTSPQQTLA